MNINLFGREIEIIKVDNNGNHLEPRLTGVALVTLGKIYFDSKDPFETLLHEIKHFFFGRTGFFGMDDYPKETVCNIFGTCVAQLMLENGDNIFARLKEFAEK